VCSHLLCRCPHAAILYMLRRFVDSVGTDPYEDVEKLKIVLAQLESKIKENYKPVAP
jgi:hypothetical protein